VHGIVAVAARDWSQESTTFNCSILPHIMIANSASKRSGNVDCNTRFILDARHETPMMFATQVIACDLRFLLRLIAFRQ